MPKTEQPYHAVFRTPSGTRLTMDFFADSRDLAYAHALCLATDSLIMRDYGGGGRLTVGKVARVRHAIDPGTFHKT